MTKLVLMVKLWSCGIMIVGGMLSFLCEISKYTVVVVDGWQAKGAGIIMMLNGLLWYRLIVKSRKWSYKALTSIYMTIFAFIGGSLLIYFSLLLDPETLLVSFLITFFSHWWILPSAKVLESEIK